MSRERLLLRAPPDGEQPLNLRAWYSRIVQMNRTFSYEWARRGVNSNAIAPGDMATEMTAALNDSANPHYQSIIEITMPTALLSAQIGMKEC